MNKPGDLKVWWIPDVPGEAIDFEVATVAEGKLILNTLADYTNILIHRETMPDYSNAGGLHVFDRGEWVEWESEEGESIDYYTVHDLRERLAKESTP